MRAAGFVLLAVAAPALLWMPFPPSSPTGRAVAQTGPGVATFDGGGTAWLARPTSVPLRFNEAVEYCDVIEVGGRSDWRLPAVSELGTLVAGCTAATGCDLGKGPAAGCYLREGVRLSTCRRVWGAQADGRPAAVDFTTGARGGAPANPDETLGVICAAGGTPPPLPTIPRAGVGARTGDFEVRGERLRDRRNGLEWQNGGFGPPVPQRVAQAYCDGLELDGASDWRLPNIHELRTAIVGCDRAQGCGNPQATAMECERCEDGRGGAQGCYRADVGLALTCALTWSSTRTARGVWNVNFAEGYIDVGNLSDTDRALAWCVRGPTLDGPDPEARAAGGTNPDPPESGRSARPEWFSRADDVVTDKQRKLQWLTTPARENAVTWDTAVEACDRVVAAGRDDWRLPSIHELRSLIVGCDGENRCGDPLTTLSRCEGCNPGVCRRAPAFDGLPCEVHWSASFARNGPWNVDFNAGYINMGNLQRNGEARFMCVRGPALDGPTEDIVPVPVVRAPSAAGDFSTRGEIVEDTARKLEWQRPRTLRRMSLKEATAHCADLRWAGRTDWRLPSIHELRSLIVGCNGPTQCGNPTTTLMQCQACDAGGGAAQGCYRAPGAFAAPCETFWSSSAGNGGPWNVDFAKGYINNGNLSPDQAAYALCVRGTPLAGNDDEVNADTRAPSRAPAGDDAFTARDGIVTDAVTGLLWTPAGRPVMRTLTAARTACDALEAGGADDWRLPDIRELRTLIVGCSGYNECGDPPSTIRDCRECKENAGTDNGCYRPKGMFRLPCGTAWSAGAGPDGPWVVDFARGFVDSVPAVRLREAQTLCVRGRSRLDLGALEDTAGAAAFVADSASIVRDTASGRVWQRSPAPTPLDLAGARRYCADLTLGDRSDWRLPTIHELRTLIAGCAAGKGCGNPRTTIQECTECGAGRGPGEGCYTDITVWPGDCAWFWSDSVDAGHEPWYIDFSRGYIGQGNHPAGETGAVRCVAGP